MNNREELENKYRELANQLAELVKPTREVVSSTDNIFKTLNCAIKNLEIHNVWNEWHYVIEQLNNWNKLDLPQFLPNDEYFEDLKTAIVSISKFGWYVNYSTVPRDVFKAHELCREENEIELDNFMCKIISNDYEDLKSSIISRYPDRSNPLTSAFKAHELGEYYLCIPVFLAQLDGITHDALNKHFFRKPDKVKKWAQEKEKEGVSKMMFAALNEITIFQAGSRPQDKNSISRHAILHGANVSYGSKVNSFKVLSLLCYLSDVYQYWKRRSNLNI